MRALERLRPEHLLVLAALAALVAGALLFGTGPTATKDEEEARAGESRSALRTGSLALARTLASLGASVEAHERRSDVLDDEHAVLVSISAPIEWDEDEQRWTAVHHPFTRPTDEWRERFVDDPRNALAYAYDIIVNGNELGGGSFRIHEPDIQSRVFDLLALTEEQQRSQFGFLLDALAMGAPPHGGIALGIDRMTMVLAGEPNLRDVIAFPKNQAGLDPMSGAPSEISQAQLDELGLVIVAQEEPG